MLSRCLGIVEDELLVAESIREMLTDLGYTVSKPAISHSKALKMINEFNPDMLLMDIRLSGSRDGVELAETIRTSHNIPIIFLTANGDRTTIQRAKNVRPNGYLLKPFTQNELYAAIEIAANNFKEQKRDASQSVTSYPNIMMVKTGTTLVKVYVHEIEYIQAEHVYVVLNLSDKRKLIVRSGLKEYLANFDPELFFQTHRSYAVNIKQIKQIKATEVVLSNAKVPLSKIKKDELLQRYSEAHSKQ